MPTSPDLKYISRSTRLSFLSFARWILGRIFSARKINDAYFQMLEKETLSAAVPEGKLRLSWLGHSTVLIQTPGGKNILLDPIARASIGGAVRRMCGVPIPLRELPHIHVCLISHDHYDHLDLRALRDVSPDLVIAGEKMRSVIGSDHAVSELGWWETMEAQGMRFTFVPAKHWSGRALGRRNARLWGGFVMEIEGRTIYYSGDTAECDVPALVHEKFPDIDIAILPIGAYMPDELREFHTTPEQSFAFFKTLGARYFLPVHWGTYDLSQEPVYEPIERLKKAFLSENRGEGRLIEIPVGGVVEA